MLLMRTDRAAPAEGGKKDAACRGGCKEAAGRWWSCEVAADGEGRRPSSSVEGYQLGTAEGRGGRVGKGVGKQAARTSAEVWARGPASATATSVANASTTPATAEACSWPSPPLTSLYICWSLSQELPAPNLQPPFLLGTASSLTSICCPPCKCRAEGTITEGPQGSFIVALMAF